MTGLLYHTIRRRMYKKVAGTVVVDAKPKMGYPPSSPRTNNLFDSSVTIMNDQSGGRKWSMGRVKGKYKQLSGDTKRILYMFFILPKAVFNTHSLPYDQGYGQGQGPG